MVRSVVHIFETAHSAIGASQRRCEPRSLVDLDGNLSWARKRTPTIGSRKAEKESGSSDFGVQWHSPGTDPSKQTEPPHRFGPREPNGRPTFWE
jgi:hypothetical protein